MGFILDAVDGGNLLCGWITLHNIGRVTIPHPEGGEWHGDNGTRETSAPDPWRALGCHCDVRGWGAAGIDGGLCLRAGVRRVPLASEPSLSPHEESPGVPI